MITSKPVYSGASPRGPDSKFKKHSWSYWDARGLTRPHQRFVRSIKEECLSRLVFFSEGHLRKTISIFIGHYRHRSNHQGIENKLIEPPKSLPKTGRILCQKELGGMLKYYYREAA